VVCALAFGALLPAAGFEARAGQPATVDQVAAELANPLAPVTTLAAKVRAGVSVTTVQPFLTYLLADGWAATVTSESSYNWNAGAGSGWLVPLTLGVSKEVQIGGEFVNCGLAYVDYLARPDMTTQAEVRFSATYVWR
jgi:hypothetical protein